MQNCWDGKSSGKYRWKEESIEPKLLTIGQCLDSLLATLFNRGGGTKCVIQVHTATVIEGGLDKVR